MLKEIVVTEELQDLIDTSITEQDKINSYPELVKSFGQFPHPDDL